MWRESKPSGTEIIICIRAADSLSELELMPWDYCFIASCYKNTTNHLWADRLVASTQKGPGRGLGEKNHA